MTYQTKTLVVLIDGLVVGNVTEEPDGRLRLTYADSWRDRLGATPLSLSMTLGQRVHGDSVVRAFLWGLLPDNEQVLDRWARSYQVSARNPFALLRHVGEDCAGAAQFTSPDRVEALVAGDGGVKWIDEDNIAERLRTLRRDPAAWHVSVTGQFSLAGAQAKTALYLDATTGRWGDPWGVVPTTHILKPAVSGLDDHDLNEHLCLSAAGLVGLSTARSQVMSFGDERAIVVERFDRASGPQDAVRRIHQEDICQALGLPPTTKYQNEGGPSPEQIVALLRQEIRSPAARADVARFVDALAFNWLIAGTDAHAKNYSVLLTGNEVRLAPLYDVASSLPYDEFYVPRLRMAMRIGGEYRVDGISGRHWRRFATENGLDPDELTTRVDELAARTTDAFAAAAIAGEVADLGSDLPNRLVDRVAERIRRCRAALSRG
jgi:serine/threonine-protein kinase HipA